jgi:beta-phosphoglucomutase-like phosphatase (HAD superfamily)
MLPKALQTRKTGKLASASTLPYNARIIPVSRRQRLTHEVPMLPRYTPHAPGVIIYDLDLVFINNEPLIQRIIAEWFAAELDISVEESHDAITEGFARTHDTYPYMAERYGKDKAWQDYANRAVHQAITDQLHTSVSHNLRLEQQLLALEKNRHVQGMLTQAFRMYADRNLELLNVTRLLHPELVLGRDCNGGLTKRDPGGYSEMLRRTARLFPNRWHVMIEDNPANLKQAALAGFTTVLVGKKAQAGVSRSVHAAFPGKATALNPPPGTHEALDALLKGILNPQYN